MVVRSLKRDVSELEYIIDTMHRGIRQDSIQAERLKYDLDSIERYGREVYFMKRDDEDVFVIKEEDEK
jgi:cell division protein FtsB